jgi:hypothetical protein
MEWLYQNWAELLLAVIAFAGTVTALTETKKDDQILDILKRILSAILLGKSK